MTQTTSDADNPSILDIIAAGSPTSHRERKSRRFLDSPTWRSTFAAVGIVVCLVIAALGVLWIRHLVAGFPLL